MQPIAATAKPGSSSSSGVHSTGRDIVIIDYDYALWPSPLAFDIANYWCECACDYSLPSEQQLDFRGRSPRGSSSWTL